MASQQILELYHRYVPRWFKVIRWRQIAQNTIEHQKFMWPCVWLPAFYSIWAATNPYPLVLCLKQPQTEEERLALKRDTIVMSTQRDWQMGQYNHGVPPYMDVWKRRQNYPEHYGDKYNGFKRDGVVE